MLGVHLYSQEVIVTIVQKNLTTDWPWISSPCLLLSFHCTEKRRKHANNRLDNDHQKAVRTSYRLDRIVEDSIDVLLGTSIEVMRAYQKQIKELEKSIKRIMAGLTQTLEFIPGIGPVFAAGIITEIGQIERFDDETKIAKYAGLYWRKHQPGRFTAENTSLSRNGNHYLRYYLVEAANSVRKYVSDYQEYYMKKYNEVPKHQHKRALVLTVRKLVRLVDALLRSHQLFTPKRCVKV